MPTSPPLTDSAQPTPWVALHRELTRYVAPALGWADAEDIAQEALLAATAQAGLRHGDDLRRWLYRVARNAMVDALRRRSRPVPASLLEAETEPDDQNTLNALVGSWLREQMELLPEPYRTALRLVDGEGLSQKRLASELGLSPSGARTQVQRGRKLLVQRLHSACEVQRDSRGNVVECDPRPGCCGA